MANLSYEQWNEMLWLSAKNSFRLMLPHARCVCVGCKNQNAIRFANAIGVAGYAIGLVKMAMADYTIIGPNLPIKIAISEDANRWYQILIPLYTMIYYFLNEIGHVKRQIEQRKSLK